MQSTTLASRSALQSPAVSVAFDDLERFLTRSRAFACALIVGLPALGIFGSLVGLALIAFGVERFRLVEEDGREPEPGRAETSLL